MSLEQLNEPFTISTLVGEFVKARRVYRNCIVFVRHRGTMINLVELEMIDFDVIMGME